MNDPHIPKTAMTVAKTLIFPPMLLNIIFSPFSLSTNIDKLLLNNTT